MYLVSAAFDQQFRTLFASQLQTEGNMVLPWLLLVLVLSVACSLVVSMVYDEAMKILVRIV